MEESNKKQNPLIQGDHSSIAVKDLHNNVDNHTDSHDMISNTTNNNTVNQNSTVVYNGAAASEKLLSERREEFRIFCEKNIVSQIINRNTRIELNEMASRLQLDSNTADEIIMSVKSKLDSGTLSSTDRVTLDLAIEALRNDDGKDMVDKLVVLADKSEDDEVQYYANLALVVYDFRRCAQRYERNGYDSYWQTFWTYLAYKRSGNNQKAEQTLVRLSAWTDYPEDQVTLLSGAGCMYDYFASNGSEVLKKTALGYLNRCSSVSPFLSNFIGALHYMADKERPLYYGMDSIQNLYLKIFGAKSKPAVNIAPKSFPSSSAKGVVQTETKGASVYELAHQVATAQSTNTTPTTEYQSAPIVFSDSSANKNSSSWVKLAIGGVIAAGAIYFMFRPSDSKDNNMAVEQVQIEATADGVDKQGDARNVDNGRNGSSSKERSKTGTQELTTRYSDNKKKEQTTDKARTGYSESVTSTAEKAPEVTTTNTNVQPEIAPEPKLSKLDRLQQSASAGDMSAACQLGQMYLNGDGVSKSNKTAFAYFLQAASTGNAEGMYWTGWCYRMGRGTKKNLDQAKLWWTKAAAAGHRQAAEDVKELQSLM